MTSPPVVRFGWSAGFVVALGAGALAGYGFARQREDLLIVGCMLVLATLLVLAALLHYASLVRRFGPFNDVFEQGRQLGHRRGYWEGRHAAPRPVVVPLNCPHCGHPFREGDEDYPRRRQAP